MPTPTPAPVTHPVATEPFSPTLAFLGIVPAAIGLVGVVLTAQDQPDDRQPGEDYGTCRGNACDFYGYAISAPFLLGGLAMIAIGLVPVRANNPAPKLSVAPWAAPQAGGFNLRLDL